jgi:hypothetical protein
MPVAVDGRERDGSGDQNQSEHTIGEPLARRQRLALVRVSSGEQLLEGRAHRLAVEAWNPHRFRR